MRERHRLNLCAGPQRGGLAKCSQPLCGSEEGVFGHISWCPKPTTWERGALEVIKEERDDPFEQGSSPIPQLRKRIGPLPCERFSSQDSRPAITIGIADEDRDLPTLAEADRSLCDRDIAGLQSGNRRGSLPGHPEMGGPVIRGRMRSGSSKDRRRAAKRSVLWCSP